MYQLTTILIRARAHTVTQTRSPSGLEPADLVVVEGVVHRELVGGAIGALALELEGHARGEGLEAQDG